GDEHGGADGRVVAQPDQERLELDLDGAAELVDGLPGEVERDHRDAVVEDRGERRHYARSRTSAEPIPPCAQMETSPNCASRRRISWARVVTRRAPVAPNGWPIAIDPPITLVRSQSTSPTGPARPSRSAQADEPHACALESTWAANASWISTTPRSPQPMAARSS